MGSANGHCNGIILDCWRNRRPIGWKEEYDF